MKRRAIALLALTAACGTSTNATTLDAGAPRATHPYRDLPDVPRRTVPVELPEQYAIPDGLARPKRAKPARSAKRTVVERPPTPSGDDFWHRLAMCESGGRLNPPGRHVGAFQFSRDTARKVGIDGSEDYETQKAAAQRWASMVDPGSRAGWPVCWWKAAA